MRYILLNEEFNKIHSTSRRISIAAMVITLSFLISSTNIFAQHHEMYLSNGEHVRLDNPKGSVYSVLTKNGKIQSMHMINPEEVVRVIVTFKDRPLSVYQVKDSMLLKTSLASVYTSLQASHMSFRTALNNIQQQLSAQLKSDFGYTIMRDYYRAMNGVAMECKRRMIDKIRALPMVQHVSLDGEVKANLTQSVHQIRADIVQDSLGYTGDGVLVGEVDTGIDYDNPALGGGFGPAFRVIGGYDFANNDNDPMDDEGHGTHVAGIIGANGGDSLRGVAPEVKFLAVKVLDEQGMGWTSDVIAGIEYCLDPDGNPVTNDAADVINMSLGGAPMTDDPLENAVNNATKAGVLSVVAAGNSGYGRYGTITSPGTSESALTVGACDSTDHIAYFSSMGPDPIHSSIKPEVVAPGVDIVSTVLDNQTESHSGTSMATPHVTGVSALLKQQHPSWTPEDIKATIINTAHFLEDDVSVFAQGRGRVDALDAATAHILVEPGVMSFGWVDLEQDVWMDTIQLTVRNFQSVSQNIQINIVDGLPAGATINFDQRSFNLGPMEETVISAILTVPSSVPILEEEPFAYLGKIAVVSDSDNVIIPFSFIKSTTLVITFDLPPVILFLVDREGGNIELASFGQGATKYIIPVSPGISLDLLAIMEQDTLGFINSHLVHHMIDDLTGLTYVLVSHDEANINMVNNTVYDIYNNEVAFDSTAYADLSCELVVYNESFTYRSRLNLGWIFPPNLDESTRVRVFFSPLDSLFLVKKALSLSRGADNFILSKSMFGLHNQQDTDISTGSDNLVGYHVMTSYNDPYLPNPSYWRKSIPVDLNTMRVYQGIYGYELESIRLDFPSFYLNQPPISQSSNFYFNKPGINDAINDEYLHNSIDIGASYVHLHGVQDSNPFTDPSILRTADFTINENGEAIFEQMRATPLPEGSPTEAKLSSAYTYETVQAGDTIKIKRNARVNFPDYTTYLSNGKIFMGCNKDWSSWEQADFYPDKHGGIKQLNGVTECRDNINSYWNIPLFTTQVFVHNRAQTNLIPFSPLKSPIVYITEISPYYKYKNMSNNVSMIQVLSAAQPYTILGQGGQSTIDCEYQIPEESSNTTYFPSFNLLQVSVNGRAVDMVRPDQNGIIRLVPFDHDSSITSMKLSLLLASGDEIVLPVTYSGNEYHASIPNYIPAGFIDILARAEDNKGNKFELTASPAFYFGSITDSARLDARLGMTSYMLDNVEAIDMEAGDTLNYNLSYTNYGSDTARNVLVTFPTTPYLKPVSSSSWTIDSLVVNDTAEVPVRLIFLGRQQSTEEYAYYSPSITWNSGGTTYLRSHKILVDFQNTITGIVQTNSLLPEKFELYQNYPNPFNPSTTIRYDLPRQSRVKIVVYDILGRKVATLVDEPKKAGRYQVIWNANRRGSGVYFYRLQAGDYSTTKKLLLLK